MPWSSTFLAQLERNAFVPVYRLRTQLVETEPNGGEYIISSAPGYGEDEVLIGDGGPTIQGSRVTPQTWASTIGQFTVPLVGDIGTLLRKVSRGTVVVLEMGFLGWVPSDFETIAFGQVSAITGSPPAWTLTCLDPLAMLRQRLTSFSTRLALFHGQFAATTLSANYTAGDATINVASTTSFYRQTGGTYAIKITPTTGDPFHLLATGSTSTTFTGSTDGDFVVWDEDTSSYVSAVVDAVSGDAVTGAVYLEGHPLDIVRRLLLSTGAGTNGVWDDYPQLWGWAIPEYLVDVDDIGGWKSYVVAVSSGSYTWQLVIEEEINDPLGWLAGLLADAGMYFTTRMGLLTVRSAQLHTSVTASPWMTDEEILDEHITAARFIGLWDPQTTTEYTTTAITTATGTLETDDDLQTLPAAALRTYDVSDRVFTNQAAVRSEMAGRLTESSCRVPEAIELVLRGLAWARLTAGDLPRVTTPRLRGRLDSTRDGYNGRIVYVTSVSPDHPGNRTVITALAYPTNDEVFGG